MSIRPRLAPHFVFRWEASQDAHILLYPEGLIKLNPAAAEILKRCDGERDAEAIVGELSSAFAAPREAIAADVAAFLGMATDKGWLLSA